jgi:hypothetical protein
VDRRRALKLFGTSAGVLSGAAWLGYAWPPSPSTVLDSSQNLAIRLYRSLDSATRAQACVEYDHPLRQYHNRGVWGGGVSGWSLDRSQARLLTDLWYAGLSDSGRRKIPNEHYLRWPSVYALRVLFCGDPANPPYQVVLTGPHLNLRIGGASREGAAFGGPQVYGDQRGNEQRGLPGNLYREQLELALRIYSGLSSEQRAIAVLATSPSQTLVELQGRGGKFAGVSVDSLTRDGRSLVRALIDSMFSNYPAEDVAYAWRCIEDNGGVEQLFLSYYKDGEVAGSGEYQIFRLEGPAAVFHFLGYPHVHAFINVARDGEQPLSVGEVIGENRVPIEGPALKHVLELAMCDQAGAELAFYNMDGVVGRLRAGVIRTGDIYSLESWQNTVVVVEVKGSKLSAAFVAELRARGIEPDPRRTYAIATPDYVANEEPELIGEIESRAPRMMVREAMVGFLRKRGFSFSG